MIGDPVGNGIYRFGGARRWQRAALLLALIALLALAVPAAAQGVTPPPLPSLTLEQLWNMTLAEVGNLLVTAVFAYCFAFVLNAVAVLLPVKVDARIWDAIFLVVTAAVAAGWQVLAGQIEGMYPGFLGMTVGGFVLFVLQWLVGLVGVRTGGIAAVRSAYTVTTLTAAEVERARAAVFLLG